jgi:cobalt-zinc-cadmium efflux system outer membrane protein
MLELGGKRLARIEAAERAYDIALAELNLKRVEIRSTVITAFYDVLRAQEQLQLIKSSLVLAQQTSSIVLKRIVAGKIAPIEETKARIAESAVQVELLQTTYELAHARRQLAAMWGNSNPQFEYVQYVIGHQLPAGFVPPLPTLQVLMQNLSRTPVLMRSKLEIERRHALVKIEHSLKTPDITVNLGVKRNEELGRNQVSIGVSMPLPLINRNQGHLQESLSRLDKANDEYIAAKLQSSNELIQAYERWISANQAAELLQKDILPAADMAYGVANKGFELGKFSFLEVLDAQRTLFQVKSRHLQALAQLHRAYADIVRIVGEIPSDNIITDDTVIVNSAININKEAI